MYDATVVNNLLSDPSNLIESGEDFVVPFGPSDAPDNRNPAFVDEYSGSQISNYISPWFFEIMNGDNSNIFTGLVDPRIPYYFVNQLDASKEPETNVEYRNGNFVSIYFGSTGPNRDGSGRSTFTMMGLYPCGGAFDRPGLDRSSPLGIKSGTGAAPFRMITYADILYIEAELAHAGKTNGDARDLLDQAISASFDLVDVVTNMAGDEYAPAISGTQEATDYQTAVMSAYDNAGSDRQLEIIMTEKWVQGFGCNIDAYTDYRRTGYPIMFDPNTMASVADGGPDGNGPVPVQSSRGYAVVFPYSADELTLNDNAPKQKVITTDKVFWDK